VVAIGGKMVWVGRVLLGLLSLLLGISAAMKFKGGAEVKEGMAHPRIGEPIFVQIALGICVWLALYLQENRLRELIPLRTRGAVDLAGSRSTNK